MAWVIFRYRPTALFSLKTSRATSTVGRTLLVPTPYAIKMAFLDAGLRNDVLRDADAFVRSLAATAVRVGVPEAACVTGTIQKVRQEPKAPSPEQPYGSNIALREVVYFQGVMSIAFRKSVTEELLRRIAPMVNYFGKRGSFVQFEGGDELSELGSTFTKELGDAGAVPEACHVATLDDFGEGANFDALNSFSSTPIKRGVHRTWRQFVVPLGVWNVGSGFVHYRR